MLGVVSQRFVEILAAGLPFARLLCLHSLNICLTLQSLFVLVVLTIRVLILTLFTLEINYLVHPLFRERRAKSRQIGLPAGFCFLEDCPVDAHWVRLFDAGCVALQVDWSGSSDAFSSGKRHDGVLGQFGPGRPRKRQIFASRGPIWPTLGLKNSIPAPTWAVLAQRSHFSASFFLNHNFFISLAFQPINLTTSMLSWTAIRACNATVSHHTALHMVIDQTHGLHEGIHGSPVRFANSAIQPKFLVFGLAPTLF